MESIEKLDVEREGPSRNLLTDFKSTVQAMAQIEGQIWLNRQSDESDIRSAAGAAKYIREKFGSQDQDDLPISDICDVYGEGAEIVGGSR